MARRLPIFIISVIMAFGILANVANDIPFAKATGTSLAGPSATVHSGTASQFLRTIIGVGVKGNLKQGKKPYAAGTHITYSFTPGSGYSAAKVVLDGKLVKPKGAVTMNVDHWLWAFGNPKNGKTFEKVMTVPADVTKIPYPAFYQKAPSFSFNVADPYCALTADVVSYPTSYLGAFPMPPVEGAPLPPDILRGVALRDYWDSGDNPAQNKGCTRGYREALTASLKKLKRLGMDHLTMYQTGVLKDVNAPKLEFEKDTRLNDTDLAWIVAQAKAAGLKYQNHMAIMGQQPLPQNPTSEWVAKLLDAWTEFMAGRAVVAERLGIEALQLDWTAFGFDLTSMKSLYVQKMAELARRVRRIYSGKTFIGTVFTPRAEDADLLKSIDWIHCPLNLWATEEENSRLNVSLLKRNAHIRIGYYAATLGADAPPVVWGMVASSHRNFFTKGWVEDSFCVPSPEDCSQRKIRTDFSVQALAFETMLEAIKEQTLLKTAGVEVCGYWYTDVLRPKDSFPNLSLSIRNKPAESIVYEWFKR